MSLGLKPGDRVRIANSTEFPCPFCKKNVTYGRMAVDNGFAAVSHALPMCDKFEASSGEQFISMCVAELEKRIN